MKIFLADYVPMHNKGEVAIGCGILDMLGADRDSRLYVLGPRDNPPGDSQITSFPWDLVTKRPPYGYRGGRAYVLFRQLSQILGFRAGYVESARNLASKASDHRAIREAFLSADLVLVGHDGSFSAERAAIAIQAHKMGKTVGVLGAGFLVNRRLEPYFRPLYRKAVEICEFVVLREKTPYDYLRAITNDSPKLRLEPDPAFAMRPASAEDAQAVLRDVPAYQDAKANDRPIVAVTVCEGSLAIALSFRDAPDSATRLTRHRTFVANLLDSVVADGGANLVFLPHCIEPGDRNDIEVARRVVAEMTVDASRVSVLDADLPGRVLKAILREADFVIGERTHSVIGSLSVGTAFNMLTNSGDLRSHDILGRMGDADDLILDMDSPDLETFRQHVLASLRDRDQIAARLGAKSEELAGRLKQVSEMVLSRVNVS